MTIRVRAIPIGVDIGPARYEAWGKLAWTMTPGNIPVSIFIASRALT